MKTRQSLIHLLRKLVLGSPHFVRCIKRSPTSVGANAPGLDKKYLTEQIRSFSLVETIRIHQRGYSYRIPFDEFLRRYKRNPMNAMWNGSDKAFFNSENWLQLSISGIRLWRNGRDDGWQLSAPLPPPQNGRMDVGQVESLPQVLQCGTPSPVTTVSRSILKCVSFQQRPLSWQALRGASSEDHQGPVYHARRHDED